MNTKNGMEGMSPRRLRNLAVVLGGGAALSILLDGVVSVHIPPQAIASTNTAQVIEVTQPMSVSPFENISLEAHAAYVIDLKTKAVLFAKNENKKLPLASVTKLMTALVARERMPESAVITLTKDDLAAEGDSGLRPGEQWRMEDLLSVMLIASSNDAARAVSGFVGVDSSQAQSTDASMSRTHFILMMNEKAHALGLTQTEFFNESGLDINQAQNGGYGSARDIAALFAELWNKYPETVEVTSHKNAHIVSQDNLAHILSNTDEIVGRIPGLIASKTGYTTLAGGNLAIIFDRGIGDPIAVVVLGSSYKGRFDDVKKLVEAARTVVNLQK